MRICLPGKEIRRRRHQRTRSTPVSRQHSAHTPRTQRPMRYVSLERVSNTGEAYPNQDEGAANSGVARHGSARSAFNRCRPCQLPRTEHIEPEAESATPHWKFTQMLQSVYRTRATPAWAGRACDGRSDRERIRCRPRPLSPGVERRLQRRVVPTFLRQSSHQRACR